MKKILLLFLISFNVWADQLIIEPDMGTQPIINAIHQAKHSIGLIMYGFTEQTLLNAIVTQKRNGKNIKIILEEHPYKAEDENNKAIAILNTEQISWHGKANAFRLIHQKTMILDHQKALVMTFNFTHSTFKNERNFALVLDDAPRVNAIDAIFSADWNHVPYVNTSTEIITSPEDSRRKLTELIQHAKHAIKIYAQNMSDYKLAGVLAKAARRGINIQILTSRPLREKQYDYLTRAGVRIRYDKKYYIHAKVLIIDDQKAVIGSINLTRSSLDENRELAVITLDLSVVKKLSETFEKDWQQDDGFNYKTWLNKHGIKKGLKALEKILHNINT